MERSHSWESNSYSFSQVIAPPFVEPDIPYRVHVISYLVSILGQISQVHTLPNYFFKIHFNIILDLRVEHSDSTTEVLHTFLFSAHMLHAASIPSAS
jgi:hypothetical protein